MLQIFYTLHITLCIGLVFLVLLQHGKGADMGAAFGGNSNTVFGAGGAPDFLTKLTTGIAVAFMCTSVLLVRTYEHSSKIPAGQGDSLSGSVMEGVSQPVPAKQSEGVSLPTAPEAAKPNEAANPAAAKMDAPAPDAQKEAAAPKDSAVAKDVAPVQNEKAQNEKEPVKAEAPK